MKQKQPAPLTNYWQADNMAKSINKMVVGMMRYHFIPQEDKSLEFFFEASSFDNAVEELVFYLEAHDEWKVKKHSNEEMAVDLFFEEFIH
jgi:hypothetical protein